ncbi:hypothetical protein [Pectobacterium aquaticum]|uniref:hypothetical protein n=1 Tax=Pectobacterium aquaticum TaxID=2204145 RepID=UPI0016799B64|nr:hypothetical protein [Pectobacterium aquaticum]MCH5051787.1 hypothetical protein [Pectobacterium aquaticum]
MLTLFLLLQNSRLKHIHLFAVNRSGNDLKFQNAELAKTGLVHWYECRFAGHDVLLSNRSGIEAICPKHRESERFFGGCALAVFELQRGAKIGDFA